MISRRRALLLAPAGVLAVGLGAVGAYVGLRSEPAVPIGGPFTLVDGDGHTVTDAAFRGRWMLVYFGYTHCPDACPMALQEMTTALDDLPPADRGKVAPIFITVDPVRDTPAIMKDYVAAFETPITALSGSKAQVAAAAREYRVYYLAQDEKGGDYNVAHSSIIYLMDPRGRFAASFTHETPPEKIAAKLRSVL